MIIINTSITRMLARNAVIAAGTRPSEPLYQYFMVMSAMTTRTNPIMYGCTSPKLVSASPARMAKTRKMSIVPYLFLKKPFTKVENEVALLLHKMPTIARRKYSINEVTISLLLSAAIFVLFFANR